jgi:hypothetical protein
MGIAGCVSVCVHSSCVFVQWVLQVVFPSACRVLVFLFNGYCRLCFRLRAALLCSVQWVLQVVFPSARYCVLCNGYCRLCFRLRAALLCFVQWVLQVVFLSACSVIVFCSMGIAGYVSVYVQLYCVLFNGYCMLCFRLRAALLCFVQWVLQVMFPSTCSFIVFCSMGIAGYVSFCVQLYCVCSMEWKHAECDHVKKRQKKYRSRILQAYENKTSYTLEDGHVGRNM